MTADPLGTGQPIFSMATAVMVSPGDTLDFVMAPNFQMNLSGEGGAQAYADFSSGSFQLITINGQSTPVIPNVPEPATAGLMAGGFLLLGLMRRRRAKV